MANGNGKRVGVDEFPKLIEHLHGLGRGIRRYRSVGARLGMGILLVMARFSLWFLDIVIIARPYG